MTQLPALLADATVTIDGKEAPAGATFDVINPATAQVLAAAPAVSPDQLDAAVSSAHAAFGGWRRDEEARRAAMLAAADVLDANAAQLSALLTAEQGKPLNAHGSGVRPDLPFGGHKWSGIGVENGTWGLYGFTETQVITGPRR